MHKNSKECRFRNHKFEEGCTNTYFMLQDILMNSYMKWQHKPLQINFFIEALLQFYKVRFIIIVIFKTCPILLMKWSETAFLGVSTETKIPGYTYEWVENQLRAWTNCVHTILQNTTSNQDKQYKAGFENLSAII